MAEYGAHISSIASGDQPSILEVLAQENLMSIIRPAFKHACRVLGGKFPERLAWLYQYSDEAYLVLDLLVQHYYLHHYCSSFAENFYSMKRVSTVSNDKPTSKLEKKVIKKSLLFLVLVPYLKAKIDEQFEKWREKSADGLLREKVSYVAKFLRLFVIVYPYIHMSYEGTMLYYNLAYAIHKSRVHSPFLHFSGIELRSLTMQDILQQSQSEKARPPNMNWRQYCQWLLQLALSSVAAGISTGLTVAVFFLQFLEWWYTSDTKSTFTAFPTPPPPKNVYKTNFPHSVCPVCGNKRTNDTALSSSGFVFCYPCIHNYVKEHGCCPVTGLPSNFHNLVKLYLPGS